MQEKQKNTGFILVPAEGGVRPAEEGVLYYLHQGACSRGHKLEREREGSSQVPGVERVLMRVASERVRACLLVARVLVRVPLSR